MEFSSVRRMKTYSSAGELVKIPQHPPSYSSVPNNQSWRGGGDTEGVGKCSESEYSGAGRNVGEE